MRRVNVLWPLMVLALATSSHAQSISQRVGSVKNGTVRMSFAARRGVCAAGPNGMYIRGFGYSYSGNEDGEEWTSGCKGQRVMVALSVLSGRVVNVRTYVGGEWLPPKGNVTDLGTVAAKDAADYLLSLASDANDMGAREAFHPATLADSAVLWPRLLTIAQDKRKSRETRAWVVSMLGSGPSDEVLKVLSAIAENENEDRSVREAAVSAIASRPTQESMPVLMRVIRNSRDNGVRAQAVQSLSSSTDPAIQEFLAELALKSK
jgi:hypothetical protein